MRRVNRNEIMGKIGTIVNKVSFFKVDRKIKPEDQFEKDLGIDSIGNVEFIDAIEEEFDFEFSDQEIDTIKTVSDILDLIQEKIAVPDRRTLASVVSNNRTFTADDHL
jgi:acyl carrier protein